MPLTVNRVGGVGVWISFLTGFHEFAQEFSILNVLYYTTTLSCQTYTQAKVIPYLCIQKLNQHVWETKRNNKHIGGGSEEGAVRCTRDTGELIHHADFPASQVNAHPFTFLPLSQLSKWARQRKVYFYDCTDFPSLRFGYPKKYENRVRWERLTFWHTLTSHPPV